MRQGLTHRRDQRLSAAGLGLRIEPLERRAMLSVQAPLIADATPYNAAFVDGVFHDALARPADTAALNWFVSVLDQGYPTGIVASTVVNSDEHAADVAQAAYQQYLGRAADSAAVANWLQAHHLGMTDDGLAAALVASDEFYLKAGGNDASWIGAAYQAVLGRAASNTDVAWGLNQLSAGASRFSLASQIATSLEHERQVVDGEYQRYMHEAPDAAGWTFWATQLATGQATAESLAVTLMDGNAYYEAQTDVPPTIVPATGLAPGWATRAAQIQASAAQGAAPVVFLGDSITQDWQGNGQAVWSQYYAPLNALNAGIAGDTTQNVLWRVESGELNGLAPKVVVLLVGVNDFASSDSPQEVAEGVAADVEALRQHLPNTKIMVLSILPAVIAPPLGNLMPVISQTNDIIAGLADGEHVFYVNLWPAFTNPDGTTRTELHVSDGLHLNSQGYAVLAQAIAPDFDYLVATGALSTQTATVPGAPPATGAAPISDAAPYNGALVNAMFHDALGHSPNAGALAWYTQVLDNGVPAPVVADSIAGSSEHAADFVQAAYRQYLGRDAEPASVTFWGNAIPTTARDEQLIATLVGSDEFYLRAGGNDAAWAAAAYEAILSRPASAGDVADVNGKLADGVSRAQIAYGLATSLEHEREVVAALYGQYLRVTPDDASLNGWATQLSTGQTSDELLAATLMSSGTYFEAQTGVAISTVPVPGYLPAWNSINQQIDSSAAKGNSQVVFLGDSITQLWMQDGAAAWAQDFAPLGALNAGIAGDETQNLLWRIENGNLNGVSPKVAVVMVGINNILSGEDAPTVVAGITAVVDELRLRLPNTKILLMGILPADPPVQLNVMPIIKAVNQSISGLADGRSVFYLDVGPYFLNADGTVNHSLYQPVIMHPNVMGYDLLASAIAPEIDELLS